MAVTSLTCTDHVICKQIGCVAQVNRSYPICVTFVGGLLITHEVDFHVALVEHLRHDSLTNFFRLGLLHRFIPLAFLVLFRHYCSQYRDHRQFLPGFLFWRDLAPA